MNAKPLTLYEPACYRLKVQGRVNANWIDWMMNVDMTIRGDGQLTVSIVTGIVRDQAGLFGLLSFIRDLGMPLISVELIQTNRKEKIMNKKITKVAMKGIAMAMGVAVIVLSTLKTLDASAGVSILGMGLAVLALSNFQE